MDLGPQHKPDKPFTATMRRHQSWYRADVLGVPCGVGPRSGSKNSFGNMLRAEDGARGLNFLSASAFQVAKARIAQGHGAVESFRLLNNMLSSMPLCFNLFGPLALDLGLAKCLLGPLLPGELAEVTRVLLEFSPTPAGEYLADRTAFDAFVEYRRPDGRLAAVGIETKLTEPFSQKLYDRSEYRRWMAGGPWLASAVDRVQRMEHNQLWRDHLLAIAMRDHPDSPYAEVRLAVVHHPLDAACVEVLDGYASLLKPGDRTLLRWPMDALVRGFMAAARDAGSQEWLAAFELRYLALGRSA